jgi:uncharacterized protein (TIGR02246 family)
VDGRHESRQPNEAIAAARAAFVAALRRGDAKAAATLYTDDATLLPPTAELIQGREAIEGFWRVGLDAGVAEIELETLELGREDGLAYEIGRYALRLQPVDEGAVVDRGKYVLVHERQADGRWRRAVEMFNPDAPPVRAGGRPKEGSR